MKPLPLARREGTGVGDDETAAMRRKRGVGGACVRSRSLQCLLNLDTELGEELDPEARRLARAAAVVLVFETEAGCLPLPEWLRAVEAGPGILILDGVLDVDVRVGGRLASELIGTGDLMQPAMPGEEEQLLSPEVTCRALVPSRFAILDGTFAKRVRFWPALGQALLRRAGRRTANLDVQRAIAGQPRLEVRLMLLFWHLAGRWGRVEPAGLRLQMPLTHRLIGQLVGAERPSVSHALRRLAAAEIVTGTAGDWHLHGSIDDHLRQLAEQTLGPMATGSAVTAFR